MVRSSSSSSEPPSRDCSILFISETEIKTNNSQSKNQNNDIERYNNNFRDYSKVCTNLKLKPKSNIRKEFEENSYRKGISETSLKKAKDYWDSNEVSYGVDPCIKKLDTELNDKNKELSNVENSLDELINELLEIKKLILK